MERIKNVEVEKENMIEDYKLDQSYPNPFNPETEIRFQLKDKSNVALSVYNEKGELVDKLLNKELSQGNHSVIFNGSDLNSGVYFYKLKVDGKSTTKKMVLIK